MKRQIYFAPNILLLAIFVMAACQNSMEETSSSQLLVVERQQMEVGKSPFVYYNKICFTTDIPISGSKVLTDSVMSFLNEQLFRFFDELADSFGIIPNSLCKNDTGQLLRHYVDAYQPLLQEKLYWLHSFGITMLAQTESFVTYGVTSYRYKSAYGSEMYCYTFSKQDGHILREIINDENLDKFFDEHEEHNQTKFEWEYDSKMEINQDFFGLLEDSLLFVVNDVNHQFMLARYGYSEILPYLTEEAKLLITQKGNHDSFPHSEWHVGRHIGTVETEKGDTIFLMEKDTSIVLPIQLRRMPKEVNIMTCTRKNGQYIPFPGFKTSNGTTSSISFKIPSGGKYSYSSRDNVLYDIIDSYDSYDAEKRELSVICSKGKDEAILRTYVFDGHQFVYTNKEVELFGTIVD